MRPWRTGKRATRRWAHRDAATRRAPQGAWRRRVTAAPYRSRVAARARPCASGRDAHELVANAVLLDGEDVADTGRVELVLDDVRLDGRELVRLEQVGLRPPEGDGLGRGDAGDLREVLCVRRCELLAVLVTDLRRRLHDDPGLGVVHAGRPRSLDADERAVVELL